MNIYPDCTGVKPCPFCGGSSQYVDSIGFDDKVQYFLCCRDCFCEGPTGDTEDHAKEWWNQREAKK